MKVLVQHGDVAQAAFFGTLDQHMATIAERAEAQAPGEAHEIEFNVTPIWQAREDVKAQATKLFFEAVERIRSTGR